MDGLTAVILWAALAAVLGTALVQTFRIRVDGRSSEDQRLFTRRVQASWLLALWALLTLIPHLAGFNGTAETVLAVGGLIPLAGFAVTLWKLR